MSQSQTSVHVCPAGTDLAKVVRATADDKRLKVVVVGKHGMFLVFVPDLERAMIEAIEPRIKGIDLVRMAEARAKELGVLSRRPAAAASFLLPSLNKQ